MFEVIYTGNVKEFENYLLNKAEQELRQKGRPGIWCHVADVYARQLTIIQHNPYPSDSGDNSLPDDITPPSLKHLSMNTRYDNFYRWGNKGWKNWKSQDYICDPQFFKSHTASLFRQAV
ncbi:hypothetical protein B0I26_1016 [Anoxybacillus vitaminiphilus]|uniref:Uncharacterized protein n=1 Tax=Paranoxybacillus vitaminiphilus TaxID=581036 RepID=A0A327YTK1_9BACL|nr:hypothetical protein [Anoxybacillus vitaminiphilus]RAK23055.1 hypothetical protein B0I26_1016 [Anoxybacillus vitaminiphilus]